MSAPCVWHVGGTYVVRPRYVCGTYGWYMRDASVCADTRVCAIASCLWVRCGAEAKPHTTAPTLSCPIRHQLSASAADGSHHAAVLSTLSPTQQRPASTGPLQLLLDFSPLTTPSSITAHQIRPPHPSTPHQHPHPSSQSVTMEGKLGPQQISMPTTPAAPRQQRVGGRRCRSGSGHDG